MSFRWPNSFETCHSQKWSCLIHPLSWQKKKIENWAPPWDSAARTLFSFIPYYKVNANRFFFSYFLSLSLHPSCKSFVIKIADEDFKYQLHTPLVQNSDLWSQTSAIINMWWWIWVHFDTSPVKGGCAWYAEVENLQICCLPDYCAFLHISQNTQKPPWKTSMGEIVTGLLKISDSYVHVMQHSWIPGYFSFLLLGVKHRWRKIQLITLIPMWSNQTKAWSKISAAESVSVCNLNLHNDLFCRVNIYDSLGWVPTQTNKPRESFSRQSIPL